METLPPALPSDDEAIRHANLKHEASVQSVGVLYLLGSCLVAIGCVGAVVQSKGQLALVVGAAIGMAIAVFQFVVGLKLRKLDPSGRVPAILLSCLGLLGFPLGTLVSIYILYLLICKKGKYVFSPEYGAVRAATPHIVYKTSKVIWALVILLILLLVAGGIAMALNR